MKVSFRPAMEQASGILLLVLVGCQQPGRTPEAQSAPAPRPTSSMPAVDPLAPLELRSLIHSGELYSFAVGSCSGSPPAQQCELNAQIRRGGEVVFTLPLPPAWSDRVTRVSPATIPGVGDPLGEPAQWIAWTIGQDAAKQSLAARLVRLAPQQEGILLRIVHDAANHDLLLLRRQDKLVTTELEGNWTALAVRQSGPAIDEILQFAQRSGEAGFVWARSLRWDTTSATLSAAANTDPPAFLVSAGQYDSYTAAEAALAKSCLRNAVIAVTDPYVGLEPKHYFVGATSGDQHLASAGLAAAKPCIGQTEHQQILAMRFRDTTIARMPLGSGNASTTLGVGRYDGTGWPLRVSFPSTTQTPATLEVSWPVNSPISRAANDVDLPAGDPLQPTRGVGGWSFGKDETTSLVALATLRMADDRHGLLVSQEAGFEHRKRRHDLIVEGGSRLRVAWSAVDPPGPAWSTVVIRAKDAHSDELVFISTFDSSQAGEADRVEVSRLAWDEQKGEFSSTPIGCDGGVHLVISRVFRSLERAITAKGEPCEGASSDSLPPPEWVLPAPPRSKLKGYVLARVSTQESLSRQAVTDATRCWPKAKATLVPWCPAPK